MTAAKRRKKPATREVGQLRYAAVDALLPLSAALFVLLVAGVATQVVYIAAAVGGVLVLLRLGSYVGK